ncbi:anti-sigma factor [Trinickia dabaoshanensis]|uniref:Anti-sigma factor n=1 Tax=Trinickia dabaoshanensis TaxID=564714 RepID=A0A2N7VBC9_9BURK|nr:anti-sigma factor [Trinickia dabaoshanensis]PMS14472.1 anti-sigma factor [Trinickia dabaoshanensis]
MNAPARTRDELRCAEYALGVLDGDASRVLERDIERDPQLRATLDRWLERLAPLAEDLPGMPPPADVWKRIERDLGVVRTIPAENRSPSWWSKATVWRWLTAGASVAAVTLLALDVSLLRERETRWPSATVSQNGYMVSTIASSDGIAHWIATLDVRRGTMIVVGAASPHLAANRSAQLWLIAPGGKPVPLGVLPASGAASLALPAELPKRMSARSALAVSVEPFGGSPTGQPTGPVIATGAIRGV